MACMIIIGFLIYGSNVDRSARAGTGAEKRRVRRRALPVCLVARAVSVAASAIVGYTVDFFGWDGGFMVMIGGSISVILLVVVMIGEKRHHDELQLKQRR